jgi:hypothetical protein
MIDNDPLGLFPDAPKPAGSSASSGSGGAGWAFVGILLGVALMLGYQRFGGDFSHGDGDGGGDEQVQPIDSAGFLYFIHERQTMDPAEADMLDDAKEWAATIPDMQVLSFDDDDKSQQILDIIAFAATKGVSPPLVVYKPKGGKYRNAIKYPKTVDDLKAVIK